MELMESVMGAELDDELDEFGEWESNLVEESLLLLRLEANDQFSSWTEHFAFSLENGSTIIFVRDDSNGAVVVKYCPLGASSADFVSVLTDHYRPYFDEDGMFSCPLGQAYTELGQSSPMMRALLSGCAGPHPIETTEFWILS